MSRERASAAPPLEGAAHQRRQRRQLVGVALMFFGPLALAFYLYYGSGGWHPGHSVNEGELISPARPLPELRLPLLYPAAEPETAPRFLRGKWTFLQLQHGKCDAACSRRLYDTRQVRLALDREMNRVQRVFIGDEDCCDLDALRASHPDLIAVRASASDRALRAALPPAGDAREVLVYVVDPLGNAMMFYRAEAPSKGMLKDMKRLLSLSSIG